MPPHTRIWLQRRDRPGISPGSVCCLVTLTANPASSNGPLGLPRRTKTSSTIRSPSACVCANSKDRRTGAQSIQFDGGSRRQRRRRPCRVQRQSRRVTTDVYDIDPIHFAVVLCLYLTLGLVTPPVGTGLFIASLLTGVRAERIAFILMPFLANWPSNQSWRRFGGRYAPAPVHVGSFECPAALSKPDVERATANGYRPLLAQSQDHLVERDVLFLFNHVGNDVRLGIEARAAASPLFRSRQPASPCTGNPGDGR